MRYRAQVITISDKGAWGERIDTSGPALKKVLEKDFDVADIIIVPDEEDRIAGAITHAIDEMGMDLIVTTGGTGVSPRDVTPEATRAVIDHELPGFAEVMRAESYKITPHAIISRAICGIRGRSIIVNLPGSEKAATECLGFIIKAIPHALAKINGDPSDCA
ncbi:MAG TPA: MogA/MoaB family molybdenum cofactor biosynthesis protein [Syntrophorhabdaceae bacterium]|nr:MogA/MoaB family molybdenum cofactor biosynthesis protein [Syntrophorhabdaceae bacterium]